MSSAFSRFRDGVVRIRTRLLVINLVAVLVPVVGIHWARVFEAEGLKALEADMRHVAEVMRTLVERAPPPGTPPRLALGDATLAAVAKRTRMRLRLLDTRGVVVADSHRKGTPEGPEAVPSFFGSSYVKRRHASGRERTNPGPIDHRVEIRAALKGQLGTATRYHRRIKRVFLFLALPVMSERRVHGAVYVTRSTIPVLEAMYRLRSSLLTVLAVALAITALLSLFLATTISRPLARLSRVARRLAGGERGPRIEIGRRDEVGQLSRSLQDLVDQLDGRATAIAELAGNISHEFKTPLSSIRGAAELIADSPEMDEKTRQRFLGNILGDVRRLDRLVSRLLELTRIEATAERREDFDLVGLAKEAVAGFSDHRVVLEAPEALPFRGNRSHLLSALGALLENGVRYADELEVVKLSLEVRDGGCAVSVVDSGPGIPEAQRERIFERFYTTEAERGGTGLGLAIAAAVARAHGGRIEVESQVGEGSCFRLVLPNLP